MIKTTRQLKDKMGNLSKGDSKISQALYMNYFMERFLERLSCSQYKNNFILKGGMLVSSILGVASRTTMDIDTTVVSISLTKENILNIIENIINIELDDNVKFKLISVSNIMEENTYPGIRIKLSCNFGTFNQMIKVDISTGDVITPSSIEYKYKLMFEDRFIELKSYNLETLLAEKLETVISRGVMNTRMRDFYDIYELEKLNEINYKDLKNALNNTSMHRGTTLEPEKVKIVIESLKNDNVLISQWIRYKNENYFVKDIGWNDAIETIRNIFSNMVNF